MRVFPLKNMKTSYMFLISSVMCILSVIPAKATEHAGGFLIGVHGSVRSTIYDRRLTYYSSSLNADYEADFISCGIEPYIKMNYPLYDMQGNVTRSSLGGVDLSAGIEATDWLSIGGWIGDAAGEYDLRRYEGGGWGSLYLLDTLYLQASHDRGSSDYSIYQGYDITSSYRFTSLYTELYINRDLAIGAELMDIQQQVESAGYETRYSTRDYRGGPVLYPDNSVVLDIMGIIGEQKESGSYMGAAASLWFEPSRWFNMFVSVEYNVFISDTNTDPYSGISLNGGVTLYFL